MTKENPEELCEECKKFDHAMNHEGGVSCDMFVRCDHEDIHINLIMKGVDINAC